jgi:alpha-tubulin suppressor-like RCC1 family protein
VQGAFAWALLAGCIHDDWRLPAGVCIDGGCVDAGDPDAGGPDAGGPDAVRVCDGVPVQALSCGFDNHACAIRCDGSVWCWGNNADGQLGDGTQTSRAIPVQVQGLGGPATAVAAGFDHTCAIVEGSVRCWGLNAFGQLGNGTRDDRLRPTAVTGLPGAAVALAAGGAHSCAVLADGAVWCWGQNPYGALGDGSTRDSAAPRAVVGLREPVASLAAGQYHTCARTRSGAVKCWGLNIWGALGDGTLDNRTLPVGVALPAPAVALSTLANHTCAVVDDGGVWCWGLNRYGAVGDGTHGNRVAPVRVASVDGRATAVATGDWHTCVTLDDGSMRCWGANDHGQLGDGTTTARSRATHVEGLDGTSTLACAGQERTCVALSDGRVKCWGVNLQGALGDGSAEDHASPETVRLPR